MGFFEIAITTIIIILMVIMLTYYIKSKKGFVKLLLGTATGVATLLLVSFVLPSFGYSLTVNIFTVAVSSILGAPGVLLLIGLLIV